MGTPEPPISLVGQDRLSQRDQIAGVLERARAKREPLRVRLPFSLYDQDVSRGYVFIRDAAWNLQLPSDQITPETIERLIYTVGQCVVAIAREGTEGVLRRLDVEDPNADALEYGLTEEGQEGAGDQGAEG